MPPTYTQSNATFWSRFFATFTGRYFLIWLVKVVWNFEILISLESNAQEQVRLLLAGASLCSTARLVHLTQPSRWQETGDPTEAALLVAAMKAGLEPETLQKESPRLREVPFDSRRRLMSVVLDWHSQPWQNEWQNEHPYFCFTKGAPLEVLRHCNWTLRDNQLIELTQSDRTAITIANDNLARQGFRVLGVAVR